MLKKRLIFTLLYNNGNFMLSRNFRLQKVGNLQWLKNNYDFSKISFFIDELILLDVTRGERNINLFCETLKALTEGCFVPIAAGGGIHNVEDARILLRSGADKVVINTELFNNNKLINELACDFGQQCIIASMDIKHISDGNYYITSDCGSKDIEGTAQSWIKQVIEEPTGELYLNSVERDGTGQGYDMQILNLLPPDITKPVILAGGVGNATHLLEGLKDTRVDAAATAHLFNFVGDGLKQARKYLNNEGIKLPFWE